MKEPERDSPHARSRSGAQLSLSRDDDVSFSTIGEALEYLERPVDAEEVERRRKLFAETVRLREEIGPVDMTLEDLLGDDEVEHA